MCFVSFFFLFFFFFTLSPSLLLCAITVIGLGFLLLLLLFVLFLFLPVHCRLSLQTQRVSLPVCSNCLYLLTVIMLVYLLTVTVYLPTIRVSLPARPNCFFMSQPYLLLYPNTRNHKEEKGEMFFVVFFFHQVRSLLPYPRGSPSRLPPAVRVQALPHSMQNNTHCGSEPSINYAWNS